MASSGNDTLSGTSADEVIDGLAGDDLIYGNGGADTLIGGLGDDELHGGTGADIYITGVGHDVIEDDGSVVDGDDVVVFDGIRSFDVTMFYTARQHLLVSWDGGSTLIENQFSDADRIETLRFADGVEVSTLQGFVPMIATAGNDSIYDQNGDFALSMYGMAGDDTLFGYGGDDTLDGGAGDDILNGGDGNDIYILGQGHDVIENYDTSDDNSETAIFAGLASTDVEIFRNVDTDLVVTWSDGSATFTDGTRAAYLIETLVFTDTTIDMTTRVADVVGTNGNDSLSYVFGVNGDLDLILYGLGGDDSLSGDVGDDRLYGGEGDDYLSGGEGDDVYYVGQGHDTISDTGYTNSEDDRIVVHGVRSTDVSLVRTNDGSTHYLNFIWDGGSVRIKDGWDVGSNVEFITFSDFVTWNIGTLNFELFGTVGNDNLTVHNEPLAPDVTIIRAGDGDDYINGSEADVSQIYLGAVGHKTLANVTLDHITLEGVDFADITDEFVIRSERGGHYTMVWDGGSLTFQNAVRYDDWTDGTAEQFNRPAALTFADGTVIVPDFGAAPATAKSPIISDRKTGTTGDDTITGDANDTSPRTDSLLGDDGDDVLYGLQGDDTLQGEAGDDELHGGHGDDWLWGGVGADDYIIEVTSRNGVTHGSGHDNIRDDGNSYLTETDRVFLNSVNYADVDMFIDIFGNLILRWVDHADVPGPFGSSLTIHQPFQDATGVETLHFKDGTVVDLLTAQIPHVADDNGTYYALSQFDPKGDHDEIFQLGDYDVTLRADDGDDHIYAGSGTYTLAGEEGNDSYYLSAGLSYISDSGREEDDADQIVFVGLNIADVEIWHDRVPTHTWFEWDGGAAQVTGLLQPTNAIEFLVFEDGTITVDDVAFEIRGSDKDDHITGNELNPANNGRGSMDEVFKGFGGDDHIQGGGGVDDMDGGEGDDYLSGTWEGDIYRVGLGHDTIDDGGREEDDDDHVYIAANFADTTIWQDIPAETLHFDWGFGSLTVEKAFNAARGVEKFHFLDNVTLDITEIDAPVLGTGGNDSLSIPGALAKDGRSYFGFDGDDSLTGGAGDDILDGGAGDDSLRGGNEIGNDTYRVGLGNDRVIETDGGTADRLEIDATRAETSIWYGGSDIYLDWGRGSVRVFNGFLAGAEIESFVFTDQTVLLANLGAERRGSAGNDLLQGDLAPAQGVNDILRGLDGNDTLFGLTGNDLLDGGLGDDGLQGGLGDDTYLMSYGVDQAYERGGTDLIRGLPGLRIEDYTFIESGGRSLVIEHAFGRLVLSDHFHGPDQSFEFFETYDGVRVQIAEVDALGQAVGTPGQTLTGTADADLIRADRGQDTVSGDAGNDRLVGRDGADLLMGDGGEDTIIGGNGDDELQGGADNDDLRGGDGDDLLKGGGGNDRLLGEGDDDHLMGEDGADILRAGTGDDLLEGGADVDRLFGQAGMDEIHGGDGADLIEGGTEDDLIFGGADGDVIRGNQHNDTIFGEDGDDRLRGGSGDDDMEGGAGADRLYGNSGNDILLGGAGIDRLDGGRDDDILGGGGGNDFLFGGSGADTFLFRESDTGGTDKIRDWQAIDRIDVRDYQFADFDALMALASDTNSGLRFDLGQDGEGALQILFIEGLTVAGFMEDNALLTF